MFLNMEKRINWKPEFRKLSELKPYEKNPRVITESGLNQLGESFDEIGNCQPININTDNTILSGHARWKRLSNENPNGEALVMVPDRLLTPKQEEAVIVRMNKNIAGQWDFNILANEFDFDDLLDWGFKESDLSILSTIDEPIIEEKEPSNAINNSEHIECVKCGYLMAKK